MLKRDLPPLHDHPDPHLLAAWDRHLATRLSANTRAAYRDDLATFAGWTGSHAVMLADVDGRAVREYLSWLATRGNGGQPYARTSVTRKLAALRNFYAYLQRRGWFEVTPIPSARALKVKMPRPLPRFLGRTEAARLMAAPPVWTPAGAIAPSWNSPTEPGCVSANWPPWTWRIWTAAAWPPWSPAREAIPAAFCTACRPAPPWTSTWTTVARRSWPAPLCGSN